MEHGKHARRYIFLQPKMNIMTPVARSRGYLMKQSDCKDISRENFQCSALWVEYFKMLESLTLVWVCYAVGCGSVAHNAVLSGIILWIDKQERLEKN